MGTSTRNGLKAFDRVRYVGLPQNLSFMEYFWKLFYHISFFLNNGKRLLTDLDINTRKTQLS